MPKRKHIRKGRSKGPELDSSAVSATKKQVRWGGEEEVESKEDSKDAVEEEESHMSEKVRVVVV
jgi:hypothetical protein